MQLIEPKTRIAAPRLFKVFMSFRASSILVLGLVWLPAVGRVNAQDSAPTEYQIKAAFLFNFAKFVEWPASAFSETNSPIVIGILGDNPFGNDLVKTVRDKTLNNRPLVIKEFHSSLEATNCHMLFISTSEKARLPQILEALRGVSVLTVSEMDRFKEAGGMINFVREGNKIRFQINEAAAKSAGLKISSKLLNVFRPPR
jgi:YfiR/HmsC-like